MAIVTLTTDYGIKDHFAASLKGSIYTAVPGVTVADISHQIAPFDLQQAAYILGHSWHRFPTGSVHIVCVGPVPSSRFNHVAFELHGHYFIGCNNGLFSLLTNDRPEFVVEICEAGKEPSSFPAIDVYVPAAAALLKGAGLNSLGKAINNFAELIRPRHLPEDDVIKGNVVYIDSYGNIVTDVTIQQFAKTGAGRNFVIQLAGDEITQLVRRYSDVDEGDKLALFNSDGLLEIAINQGKANQLLNIRMNAVIRVEFNS